MNAMRWREKTVLYKWYITDLNISIQVDYDASNAIMSLFLSCLLNYVDFFKFSFHFCDNIWYISWVYFFFVTQIPEHDVSTIAENLIYTRIIEVSQLSFMAY